jgi:hypothetical protein
LFALLLAAHLCHGGVLWTEEDLPLAVALQMLRGATLYKDVWFDKPPLVSAIYLLWGVKLGWVLRAAGAVYAFIASLLAYALAKRWWSQREGFWAAGLIAFFLTFDTHSAVLPLAADLLLLVPNLAAVYFVVRRQFFWGGAAAGIGFLFNAKGLFVLAACAIFGWDGLLALLAGFILPNLAALGYLAGTGALGPYIDQVWKWPSQYASSPVVSDPVWNGAVRTANWLGFHAVLVTGAFWFWRKESRKEPEPWRLAAWAVLSMIGVALGWRFFPRYYFLLLPPLTLAASRGLSLIPRRAVIWVALATLIVPAARFGPRYLHLSGWNDLALDEDSRAASKLALQYAPPGGTLYVWGYRPEDYLYTRLLPATRYLECQALTGVPADRHLTQSAAVLTSGTHEAREELAASRPDIVIDGLSLYNPALSMDRYSELRNWINEYKEVGRTKGSIVLLRRSLLQSKK